MEPFTAMMLFVTTLAVTVFFALLRVIYTSPPTKEQPVYEDAHYGRDRKAY